MPFLAHLSCLIQRSRGLLDTSVPHTILFISQVLSFQLSAPLIPSVFRMYVRHLRLFVLCRCQNSLLLRWQLQVKRAPVVCLLTPQQPGLNRQRRLKYVGRSRGRLAVCTGPEQGVLCGRYRALVSVVLRQQVPTSLLLPPHRLIHLVSFEVSPPLLLYHLPICSPLLWKFLLPQVPTSLLLPSPHRLIHLVSFEVSPPLLLYHLPICSPPLQSLPSLPLTDPSHHFLPPSLPLLAQARPQIPLTQNRR